MHVGNDAAEAVGGSDRAVVRSLGAWITIAGPTKRMSCELGKGSDERVLLFDSVPGLFVGDSIPNFLGKVSKVSVVGDKTTERAISPNEAFT